MIIIQLHTKYINVQRFEILRSITFSIKGGALSKHNFLAAFSAMLSIIIMLSGFDTLYIVLTSRANRFRLSLEMFGHTYCTWISIELFYCLVKGNWKERKQKSSIMAEYVKSGKENIPNEDLNGNLVSLFNIKWQVKHLFFFFLIFV